MQGHRTVAGAGARAGDRIEELVQPPLLAADRDQLRGEVGLRVGVAGALGEADRVAGQPLGLVEATREARPHAAPGQRRVPVERLLELGRDAFELGVPPARLVEIAELGEVVEQPVAGERCQLGILELAGQGEHLLTDAAALRRMVDVQERGVAAHQGGGERRRLGQPPRHVERLVGEHQRLPLRLGEDEVSASRASTRTRSALSPGPSAARTSSSRSA